MHLRRMNIRAAIWLRWSLWWPIALAILDRLHQTSPQPFCNSRCRSRGQSMISMPVFATYRSLVVLQLSMSAKALESWILLSSGRSPVFKHSVMKGANSSMAVRRSLRFKPSAVIVRWSNLFISMQTAQVSFLHLPLTLAIFPPSSWHRQYGQFWSPSSCDSLVTGSPRQVQSNREAVQTSHTRCRTISSRSSVYTRRATVCLASPKVCVSEDLASST